MIGQRFGSYTIVDKLGEGGMGVVYRATDSRLRRDVALKLLPEAAAADAHALKRFQREAQLLASLNHPNIAAIYGVEEADARRALVMELVEGEELSQRIARGRLPLEDSLRIALDIARALEAAHERGVIHRDLKPANVKLQPAEDAGPAGRVKVLDFGLAKALESTAPEGDGADLTDAPTMSVAATEAGMILGTAAYMSPEQARAQSADRRADIWSFGAILYEMLAGRRAFAGRTVADTLARVLEGEPDWSALPAATPPAIRALVERCLVKDPHHRLQAIGDARLVLEEELAGGARTSSSRAAAAAAPTSEPPVVATRSTRWLALAPWVIALGAVIWAGVATLRDDAPEARSAPLVRFQIPAGRVSAVALSADGTRLAYVARDASGHALYLRSLAEIEPVVLARGESLNAPVAAFFSPDGQWVGFVTAREVRKVRVSGGESVKICDAMAPRGATWLPDDTIVLAPQLTGGLVRVPAAGGEPTALTQLDVSRGELFHYWPQALPGGDRVLFTSSASATTLDEAWLEVVSLDSGERKVVLHGGTFGRYLPTGHLVFLHRGVLFAVPFDLERLEVRGPAASVPLRVAVLSEGNAWLDVSSNGVLAYVEASEQEVPYPIVWVDRDGAVQPLWSEPGIYGNPRLSPDGRELAVTVHRDGNWDIWVYDLERQVSRRLTFEGSVESEQVWSPDGQHLVIASDRDPPESLYRIRSDGSGELERLTEAESPQWPLAWSADGRHMVYLQMTADTATDIWYLDLDTREASELVATPHGESFAELSPDGRFIAYESSESGEIRIYVRPFPSGSGMWQVSEGAAAVPRWSDDGRELFWRTNEGIVAAEVDTRGETFRAGKPKELFTGPFLGGIAGLRLGGQIFADYDVAPDGQRFVMFPDPMASERAKGRITVVTGWFDELENLRGDRSN